MQQKGNTMSEGSRSEAQYPKMVYPHGNSVHHTLAGSPETDGFSGVIVKNEDEEKWVMDGNKLEDFGKEPAKAEGWDKK